MQKIIAFSRRIYTENGVTAVRKGLLFLFPLILIASFATIFLNLPGQAYSGLMLHVFGKSWQNALYIVYGSTMGIISVALVITISYALAEGTSIKGIGPLSPSLPCVVSLVCFFSLAWSISGKGMYFLMSSDGILNAIVTGVFATRLFLWLYALLRQRIASSGTEMDPVLTQALYSIFPAAITILVWTIAEVVIVNSGFHNISEVAACLIKAVLGGIGNTFFKLVAVIVLTQILWFFGIHGNMVLGPLLADVLSKTADIHYDMLVRTPGGTPGPEILIQSYMDVFVNIGGTGCTLSLLIAILLSLKRSGAARLAKLSVLPAFLNINEIVIFGLPVVLNPILLIPFLAAPLAAMILSYLAILTGIVPHVSSYVAWTIPPLFNAYYACGSFMGVLLQIVVIAVGTVIYLPFVKANERMVQSDLDATFQQLKHLIEGRCYGATMSLLSRKDEIGILAGMLSRDILSAIKKDEFLLEYQPLIDSNGEVKGVEALLRWPHKRFGRISPLLVTAIAEEAGSMNELGKWVIRKACCQLACWKAEGLGKIGMSINISPTQLQYAGFSEELLNCIQEYGMEENEIELEITENIVIDLGGRTRENIERISARGIRLAMDDFGMGYTSLLYIRHFNIDTIKIDGSIIRDILKDKSCRDIVSSLVYLCNTLNIKVIAEYVEETGQFELLRSLGCSEYQGYLFSPPLPEEAAARFIRENSRVPIPC